MKSTEEINTPDSKKSAEPKETPTPMKVRKLVSEVAILSRKSELANNTPKRKGAKEKLSKVEGDINRFLAHKGDRLHPMQKEFLEEGLEDISAMQEKLTTK